ncbi:16S rRNA (cytidine(1402)-2'-O)-methyltransferase [Mangrovimicrobium sediminis]|uniref:Ribosomal RNA small subunit methyltransferase I n=1 Tax=Mangrovimicrobium sediminis TaxID=2562682 RepID=A0A4Z0M307_9GAMM|nr:16S rRNA (cytidine(1402)-2'-O)-methyltransferase [Haliea sp. SAOS-164]TGD74073.1 16S rRNA (cytidine(1402)-2'-O)-methyltransferase [Haliea sp. SAOS-164]
MDSGLYIVATPIGNLGDLSPRALDVLRAADLIAAEDTRHSARLLQHFGVTTATVAYHEHSDERARERILEVLRGGGVVALVSDAGTPLISDPGYPLIRAAQAESIPVRPIPGPCAAIAALSAGGLPTDRFQFEGFLPAKAGARRGRLEALATQPATLVFYEAPHRVLETLAAMAETFGAQREAVLAREITKTFETVRRDSLGELHAWVAADSNQQRGEIVLLVAGCPPREQALDEATGALLKRLAEELPAKRAAAVVADITGLRKKLLYDFLLEEKQR